MGQEWAKWPPKGSQSPLTRRENRYWADKKAWCPLSPGSCDGDRTWVDASGAEGSRSGGRLRPTEHYYSLPLMVKKDVGQGSGVPGGLERWSTPPESEFWLCHLPGVTSLGLDFPLVKDGIGGIMDKHENNMPSGRNQLQRS